MGHRHHITQDPQGLHKRRLVFMPKGVSLYYSLHLDTLHRCWLFLPYMLLLITPRVAACPHLICFYFSFYDRTDGIHRMLSLLLIRYRFLRLYYYSCNMVRLISNSTRLHREFIFISPCMGQELGWTGFV